MKDEIVLKTRDILLELYDNDEIDFVVSQKIKQVYENLKEYFEKVEDRANKRNEKIKYSYQEFNPISEVTKVINGLSNAIALYGQANEEINYYNNETQDILHAIELTDMDEETSMKLFNDLKKNRENRRIAKNFVELVEPLHDIARNNVKLINELGKVQAKIQITESVISNRKYRVREKTDLELAFEKAYERKTKVGVINYAN